MLRYEDEITEIDQQIADLEARKKTIMSMRRRTMSDPRIDFLVENLDTKPTVTRLEIGSWFPDMTWTEVSSFLQKARERGAIKNVGTRRVPLWVVNGKKSAWSNGSKTPTQRSKSKQRK